MSAAKNFSRPYRRSKDQDTSRPARHRVVIVGGGPVGLSLAADLGVRGVPCVVVDGKAAFGEGSRGICYAKRTLEILDRLGVGERAVEKGVTWQLGKVFRKEELLYQFDLLPEAGHKMPAFVNLQQYYLEQYLYERCQELPAVDLRFQNRCTGVEVVSPELARIRLETPDGPYALEAEYLIACDGSRSLVRQALGLSFAGRVFEDRFLIADVKMPADYPAERWFWFDPPFNPGQSALLHKQPDDIWRIDLQLGWDADPVEERRPERVRPRLEAMLGKERPFELEWISIYTFQCRRLQSFVHGPVIFAGDAAHLVSPFGARGFNSGVQDTDNLAWKLAAILAGRAPAALLATYRIEREAAADENLRHSTRSTDFITPKSHASRVIRDAALSLAAETPFARALVNSGRLSTPTVYDTPLSTPDTASFGGTARLGGPLPDAPLVRPDGRPVWLLNLLGPGFTLLYDGAELPFAVPEGLHVVRIGRDALDEAGLFRERYDAQPGSAWLVRPDQHLCARFRAVEPHAIGAAMRRALGWELPR
ncbi:FAD-dependent oxidoreductase [Benzoatithermus flavus]|uniref:FAD-dependent oxidoreductase n=1 Tax=Benzoatithermus flavus TaxID=3108223 RepID=A0ABU8XUY2_9PROT